MNILTAEQFESADKLLKLLDKLAVQVVKNVHNDFIEKHEANWTTCDYCSEFKKECLCNDDDGSMHGRYYAAYDDEASFE